MEYPIHMSSQATQVSVPGRRGETAWPQISQTIPWKAAIKTTSTKGFQSPLTKGFQSRVFRDKIYPSISALLGQD
jgi:hypothetical protein